MDCYKYPYSQAAPAILLHLHHLAFSISSRRNCHATHLRAIRKTGTFKLLCKKSPVEGFQPFQYCLLVIHSFKSHTCKSVNSSPVQILHEAYNTDKNHEVHKVLPDLLSSARNLAILRRQKLRTYRCIQNIQKNFFQLLFSPQVSA